MLSPVQVQRGWAMLSMDLKLGLGTLQAYPAVTLRSTQNLAPATAIRAAYISFPSNSDRVPNSFARGEQLVATRCYSAL